MKKTRIDLTGMRFGRLVAIESVGKNKSGNTIWLCECDCGNRIETCISNLRTGHTKSCGCYAAELKRKRKTRTTHGKSYSRLYHIWQGMKQRCNDPKTTGYQDYGGRGICVCEEWQHSFQTFQDWAISNGYAEDLTIDRINVDGNYEPSNCRWENMKAQNRNKRTTTFIELNGEKKSIGEWHELLGIPISTIVNRKNKGLPAELILKQGRFNTKKPDYEAELERMKAAWKA